MITITKYPNGKLKSLHIPFADLTGKKTVSELNKLDFADKAEWLLKAKKIEDKHNLKVKTK